MLEPFGDALFLAEGPVVSFYGFPYATRMAVIRLSDGGLFVWSPVALDDALAAAVDALGPVRHIVSPNKIHHLFLAQWVERWPEARLHAPPGLAERKPQLHFHEQLGDLPHSAWAADVDQVVFRGSFVLEEVVFFHRASRSALFCDLIQRHDPATLPPVRGALMRLDALVGPAGSTPREWRASFLNRAPARAARDKVLSWEPERLVIAHGSCVGSGATPIVERALRWI